LSIAREAGSARATGAAPFSFYGDSMALGAKTLTPSGVLVAVGGQLVGSVQLLEDIVDELVNVAAPNLDAPLEIEVTGEQLTDVTALSVDEGGEYDATLTERYSTGISGVSSATRSDGAMNVVNTGVYGGASGGQVNYSGYFEPGDFYVAGGDVTLGGAADSIGFYGTAAIAKQTGVAVTAEAIHAALVALGLIGV
jgi:hypothetical protein